MTQQWHSKIINRLFPVMDKWIAAVPADFDWMTFSIVDFRLAVELYF